MFENLSFLQKNGLEMQNHRLGIRSDKIWADTVVVYFQKYPIQLPNCQSAIIFAIFKKKLSFGVRILRFKDWIKTS